MTVPFEPNSKIKHKIPDPFSSRNSKLAKAHFGSSNQHVRDAANASLVCAETISLSVI